MIGSPLLSVKHLSIQFQQGKESFTAVDSISFNLLEGEVLGLVGESGSGKSLTALSIMQLIANPVNLIKNGEILFQQDEQKLVDLMKLEENSLQKIRGKEIAMIFQEPMTALNPVLTCGYQIMEPLRLHLNLSKKEAKLRCLELFKEVHLTQSERIFSSYPHQLSGGQKQRVLIAMALSCKPKLLIADEPTTALDVSIQKNILKLLRELQQKHKMSILFISHDLGVIGEIADRVLVMRQGKLLESATTMTLFSEPQHPYTKGLLACRPPLHHRLKRLPTISDFLSSSPSGENENPISINALSQALELSIQERKSRLERIYSSPPLLEVRDLSCSFSNENKFFGRSRGKTQAVKNVSFVVYPGETLGLVGESGCGKTTLGRCILRLIEPDQGSVHFLGKNLMECSASAMRQIRTQMQMVFQDPYSSLNPQMTIGSAILEPLKVHGILNNDKERKKRVIELLERLEMNESHYHRFPHEFSGGQRQRICIARALIMRPKFIVCDESVSALDVSVQAQVLNLLNELKHEFDFTSIFISHDLSVVKYMSDRMMVMKEGEIIEIGDADEIYQNPQTEYTQALIRAIPGAA